MEQPGNETGSESFAEMDAAVPSGGSEATQVSTSPVDVLLNRLSATAEAKARREAESRNRLSPLLRARDALWACSTVGELIPAELHKASWVEQDAFLHSQGFAHQWIEKWKDAITAIRELEAAGVTPREGMLAIEPRDGIAEELRDRVICVRDLFLLLLRGGDDLEQQVERDLARLVGTDRGSFSAHAWYFRAVAHELETHRKQSSQSDRTVAGQSTASPLSPVVVAPAFTQVNVALGPSITTHLEEPPAVRKHTLTVRLDVGAGGKSVHHRIHGRTQANLARMVIELPNQDHTWEGLLAAGAAKGAWGAIQAETLRRAGSSIQRNLPPQLKGYWQQGMSGVRWQTE